ncbi:sensor histidine kinase [Pseudofrankia asymbiotica]|uniref:histidine kinase n=1 Tax=Pseudofrankia asymbiotica TaxID=1834516 RepID=A0A1V2I4G2_9ACTN|nr:histidine kinase [Pseudofrankia asymbiotica]ONH25745.1 hypothetical protein BL253_26540 [Pseudofrankia asymbiotica]
MGAVGTGGRVGVRRMEYRWLLPALLTQEIPADGDGGRSAPQSAPRSARDWAVDVVLFVAAVWGGLAVWVPLVEQAPDVSPALRVADLAAGLVTCAALWWRRRWPVTLTLVLTPLGVFSASGSFGLLILMFSVAVHRRPPVAAAVAGVFWLPGFLYPLVWPDPELSYAGSVVLTLGLTVGVTGWGMFIHARRQLVISWRERAALADAERHRQVADARRLERLRIAREMHDVLGHRLSLLTMHAGALEFRPNAPPEQLAHAAGAVRTSARQALAELREVIGLLRQDDAVPESVPESVPQLVPEPGPPPESVPPHADDQVVHADQVDQVFKADQAVQVERVDGEGTGPVDEYASVPRTPGLADLASLVGESRRAGTAVRAYYRVVEPHTIWPVAARGAYRIVQEALTNVRKHAPGWPVTLMVDGSVAEGLRIEVRNQTGPSGDPEMAGRSEPTGGTGLVGLAERAALAGGALRYEVTADGEFRLCAWLSWTPVENTGITTGTRSAREPGGSGG